MRRHRLSPQLSSSLDNLCRNPYDCDSVWNIVNDGRTRPDKGFTTNFQVRIYNRPRAHLAVFANLDATRQCSPWINVTIIPQQTVMIDPRTGVDTYIMADSCSRIEYCSRHDHHTLAKFHMCGKNCLWVDDVSLNSRRFSV